MKKQFLPGFRVFEIFFWVYFIWYYLPFARAYFYSQFYNQIFFCFLVVAVLLCSVANLMRTKKIKLQATPIWPVLAYMLAFLFMVSLDMGTAGRHIRVSFTFWVTLFVYYLISQYPDAKRRLTNLVFVLFLCTMITSVIGVVTNQAAARILTYAANDIEEDMVLRLMNIGGISFFQGMVICVPICGAFLYKRQYCAFCCIFLATVFIGIIAASFTISILMLLFAFLLTYLVNNSSYRNVIIGVGLSILVLLIPWGVLLSNIAKMINNEMISVRLEAIATALSTGVVTGKLGGRMEVYQASLVTFLEHPLGVGPEYTFLAGQNGIGYHSQILDDLARYGIFAIAFYVVFFLSYYKLLRKNWETVNMSRIAMPVTVIYFLFLLLNLGFTSAHESVLMLFLLPSLPLILKKNKTDSLKCEEEEKR